MSEYHPDRETLERFSGGELLAEEAAWIETHLRSGCAVCQRTVDEILMAFAFVKEPEELAVSSEEEAWKRLFSRLEQRLVQIHRERSAAPVIVAELLSRPAAEWKSLAQNRSACQTLAACELLIERSFEEGFQDPIRSIQLAELAIHVIDRLDAAKYGPTVVQDLRARAWGHLGNARRLSSDLSGAEQALIQAEAFSEEGSADPLEEARILDFRASLLCDQGWFESAAEVLEVVIDIYEEVRDPHRKGRALISQGHFLSYAGKAGRAVKQIRHGLALIDGEQEPRLLLMARHNLVWALNDAGRPQEALQQLECFRHSYAQFPESWTGLRLPWLEGRIAIGLGRLQEAERRLREVRGRYIEQGLGYEASMVTLDLAGLYLQQGRAAEVRALALEMLPIFLSQDVHHQALAALAAFQHAAEMDRATPCLVRDLAAYLLRARRNPQLAFQE